MEKNEQLDRFVTKMKKKFYNFDFKIIYSFSLSSRRRRNNRWSEASISIRYYQFKPQEKNFPENKIEKEILCWWWWLGQLIFEFKFEWLLKWERERERNIFILHYNRAGQTAAREPHFYNSKIEGEEGELGHPCITISFSLRLKQNFCFCFCFRLHPHIKNKQKKLFIICFGLGQERNKKYF